MKTAPFALPIVMIAFVACSKDDPSGPQPSGGGAPTIEQYSLLQEGNYWIYEQVDLDSTGAPTGALPEMDSVWVAGDSLVDGITWTILRTTPGGAFPPFMLQRDSADYLIEHGLGAIMRTSPADALVRQDSFPNMITIDYTVFAADEQTTVPAGNFACKLVKGITTSIGAPVPPDHRAPRRWWRAGVGMVVSRVFYYMNGQGFETRLVSYAVQ